MKLNLSPIRILIVYLTLMILMGSCSYALWSVPTWISLVRNLFLLSSGAYGVYRVLLQLKKTPLTRWEHRYITISILYLLMDPMYPWWVFLLLGIVAELLQRLIRLPTGPAMNPAALALFVFSLFGYWPSWWGTSFAPRLPIVRDGVSIAVFLTVPVVGYVAHKYKKLPIVGVFMSVFALCYLLFTQENPTFLIIEGTVAFFALVMAAEPKTSPVMRNQQIVYAVALGVIIPIAIKIYFLEPYCGPLILCNLLYNLYRNQKFILSKIRPMPKPISPPVPPPTTPLPTTTS